MPQAPESSFWRDRLVLVTGGCGFIGSHLAERLLAFGADVRVLGKYASSATAARGFLGGLDERFGDRLDIRLGTVSDPTFVRDVADGVDTIFHLAALIGIPYSYVAPGHYVEVNVTGTLAVLEAAKLHCVRRIVHTSTSETFGTAQYVPMDEQHPLVAQSPYAATKVAADQLAGSYFRSFGTPVVTLRPFNTFGPRQSPRAVIPTIVHQLLVGGTVRIGSTRPVRDMNPVDNTVDAFLLAGQTDGIEGELFVVGSGVGRSIGEIIDVAASKIGTEPTVVTEADRVRPAASEVERLICDYSKAAERLGYTPRVGFDECMEAVVEYCKARPLTHFDYAI
jgi:nucleoside-diphosphate-sugar epimerase